MAHQDLRQKSGFVLLHYEGGIFHQPDNNVERALSSMKAGLKISLVFPSNCVVGV